MATKGLPFGSYEQEKEEKIEKRRENKAERVR